MGVILFLAWGSALILYDLRFKRLPNCLTLPAGAISLVWWSLPGLIWVGAYALFSRGLGGGDIKLALPLGMWTAHVAGVMGVLVAMMGASLSTVLWAAASRDKRPAHGPGMLLSAGVVMALYPELV
ncbi:prepilin peptidase [Corynebacterium sp.]|uniref:prepilin peptidase n=1 Tax=Corynebacterium sp. TaxID=1720 RepID=UPI0026DCAB7D|nr:prepilin peptidase [Corynebacterium sp.]MDO5031774.1 prepilin peptidase [Corynebacterium sp.]